MRSLRNLWNPHRDSERAGVLTVALVLGLVCAPAARILAGPPPFEKLVPAEQVTVYVSVKSVPELLEKFRASPRFKLLSEPEMQKFVDKLTELLRKPREEMARTLGTDPKELEKMLGGQVCLAVLPRGDRDAHWLLLADVSRDPQMAENVVQSILKHEREGGKYAIKEDSFHGRTIYQVEPIEEEKPKQEAAPQQVRPVPQPGEEAGEEEWEAEMPPFEPEQRKENPGFITVSEGILALASSPDRSLLEKHLVLREGGDIPSLAGTEVYGRLESHMGEDRDAAILVDLLALAREEEEETPFMPDLSGFLGDVKALGLGLSMRADGLSCQGLMWAPGPRKGLLKAFAPQGGGVMPPAYVEKEVGLYAGLHFSVPVMWEELKAFLQSQWPQMYPMIEQQLQTLPVDFENDMVKAFGSRWFFYMPALGTAKEPAKAQVAFCGDLRNSTAFSQAFQQLMASPDYQGSVEKVDFMGVTLYQFGAPTGFEMEEPTGPAACMAIMADKLLFATSLDLAKSVISNDKREVSPLVREAEFRQLLGHTMEDPDAILFVDGRVVGRWVRQAVEEQRKEARAFRERFPGPAGEAPEPEELPEMPSWDVLEKYQTASILTAKWVEDGLLIKAWSPHPRLDQPG